MHKQAQFQESVRILHLVHDQSLRSAGTQRASNISERRTHKLIGNALESYQTRITTTLTDKSARQCKILTYRSLVDNHSHGLRKQRNCQGRQIFGL